jgi:hypothetical protein
MRWGWTPADADVTIRARGVSPYRRTASALATTRAAAPSDSGEDGVHAEHAKGIL